MKTICQFPKSPLLDPQTKIGDLLLVKKEHFQQVLDFLPTLTQIFTMIEMVQVFKWVDLQWSMDPFRRPKS